MGLDRLKKQSSTGDGAAGRLFFMKNRKAHPWPTLVFILIVFFGSGNQVLAQPFQAGAASVVITPPVGTPMAGYYHTRKVEGVHDDLFARDWPMARSVMCLTEKLTVRERMR
jgi:hypothetical protein